MDDSERREKLGQQQDPILQRMGIAGWTSGHGYFAKKSKLIIRWTEKGKQTVARFNKLTTKHCITFASLQMALSVEPIDERNIAGEFLAYWQEICAEVAPTSSFERLTMLDAFTVYS